MTSPASFGNWSSPSAICHEPIFVEQFWTVWDSMISVTVRINPACHCWIRGSRRR
jgi:hypothetical protein